MFRIPIEEVTQLAEKFRWDYRADAYGEYIDGILSKYQSNARAVRRIGMVQDTEEMIEHQFGKLAIAIAKEKKNKDPRVYLARITELTSILAKIDKDNSGKRHAELGKGGPNVVNVNFNTLQPVSNAEARQGIALAAEVVDKAGESS